jgi:hypothetical protein
MVLIPDVKSWNLGEKPYAVLFRIAGSNASAEVSDVTTRQLTNAFYIQRLSASLIMPRANPLFCRRVAVH